MFFAPAKNSLFSNQKRNYCGVEKSNDVEEVASFPATQDVSFSIPIVTLGRRVKQLACVMHVFAWKRLTHEWTANILGRCVRYSYKTRGQGKKSTCADFFGGESANVYLFTGVGESR